MLLVVVGLISRLPLIRWPVADPNHELSLIGLLLNFYPQALNLSMAVSQRPLFPRPLVLLWGSGCVGMGVPGHAPGMWVPLLWPELVHSAVSERQREAFMFPCCRDGILVLDSFSLYL